MRESNFAFPAQNRACVCISSQLYDRRALDTTSPLPLFNSLTHLTYLTSTSPRIREILTMDGGLERLVRLLRDFCAHPPPPESPALFYGLLPAPIAPPAHPHPPHDPKRPFDRAAAYRFSLAFQCVVNIGVRGSEPIRARVVQAGTLDVVGCVLEAWLAGKGFAVAPSASASGMPRETREQRQARRQAVAEMRQREVHALQAQELARALQRQVGARRSDEDEEMHDASSLDAEREPNHTPPDDSTTSFIPAFMSSTPSSAPAASDTSNDTSPTSTPRGGSTPAASVPVRNRSGTVVARPATSTESEPDPDGDVDMEPASAPPPRIVGADMDLNLDMLLADGPPGNMPMNIAGNMNNTGGVPIPPVPQRERRDDDELTPRARFARLPDTSPAPPVRERDRDRERERETGPYREEDVLLSLQLLAYLSKYPHVRQAFYKPRAVFNPAMQAMHTNAPPPPAVKEPTASGSFFKALAGATVGRGKEKHRAGPVPVPIPTTLSAPTAADTSSPPRPARPLTQSTNVFSLVERFTFRPSPNETALPAPPPLLPPEIQYWAGVIMRNACRKDESRGGIRQCANMLCGRWESFPREFAKCRRCRKAKYCGKECQSRAWAEGHRFWCSAREEGAEEAGEVGPEGAAPAAVAGAAGGGAGTVRARAPAGPSARAPATTVYRAGPEHTHTHAHPHAHPHAHVHAHPHPHPRPRANALATPQHAPYLQMAGANTANTRRRAGAAPGPSVSTTDLPGTAGSDDMVLG